MTITRFVGLQAVFLFLILIFSQNGMAQEKTHLVKSGETLSAIARKYKTTVAELIRLNPEASQGLKAGESLRLSDYRSGKAEKGENAILEKDPLKTGVKTHKVISGESLSRIAKKYRVSVKDLENWNGIRSQDLKAGQEIQVSAPGKEAARPLEKDIRSEEPGLESNPSGEEEIHTVSKGETLSGIARKYKTTVERLKEINRLKSTSVALGQELRIPGSKIAPDFNPSAAEPAKGNTEAARPAPARTEGDTRTKPAQPAPVAVKSQEKPLPTPSTTDIPLKDEEKPIAGIREVNNTFGYTRVVETGFAEAIEGDVNSKKHLCLHKTAPVGSILQVKNEMNGQSVFVKVIGKLPETGSNEKLIIRISRQAYEKLLAAGKRFPVEVSYPEAQ